MVLLRFVIYWVARSGAGPWTGTAGRRLVGLTAAEKKAGINRDDRDPADSPGGKHLAGGGSIKHAPADGLWATIQEYDRFEIETKKSGDGSVSDTHSPLRLRYRLRWPGTSLDSLGTSSMA
jgi:hypothetical protein